MCLFSYYIDTEALCWYYFIQFPHNTKNNTIYIVNTKTIALITIQRSERSSYQQSYMISHLDDMQTAQTKTFKKIEKKNYKTVLRLAASFKTITRHGLTVTLFDGLFLGKYKSYGCEILTQSSVMSSISVIKIWYQYL